jgi:hypothetical protein
MSKVIQFISARASSSFFRPTRLLRDRAAPTKKKKIDTALLALAQVNQSGITVFHQSKKPNSTKWVICQNPSIGNVSLSNSNAHVAFTRLQ